MLADRVRMGREKGKIEYIGEVYLAQDGDFVKVNNRWVYRGSELEIEIPHIIQGEKVTSYEYMFYGTGDYLATPVTRVDSNNKKVTSMSYMFYASKATTLNLSSFDTSNVTSMANMFSGSNATTLDLNSFDTSSVTSMTYMFYNSSATALDLSSFDTSNVTNMSYMFYNSKANTLDLSSFDTSNVRYMDYMFTSSSATTLNLSSFDTSNLTIMTNMFSGSNATTLNLSSFDTSNVTSMDNMFRDSKATTLDLSSLDTSKVTSMSFMFSGSKATTLDLSSFDTSNVTNMGNMFRFSSATTGYARTQEDADRFNASTNKPAGLVFVVAEKTYGSVKLYPNTITTVNSWSNPSNAKADDGVYATTEGTRDSDHDLIGTNFDISSIPPGSIINDITLEVQYKVSNDRAVWTGTLAPFRNGAIDNTKALTTSSAPENDTIWQNTNTGSWTLEDLELDGILFRVRREQLISRTFSVDYLAIIVNYTTYN